MTKTAGKYVTEIDRDCFDAEMLDLYWQFVAERQNAYVRRAILGLSHPWSADPVLQVEFITNVYRILDPGTEYLVDNILSYRTEDDLQIQDEDIIFNVMLYRLMGSVPSTHQHLGFQIAEEFDEEAFLARLKELPEDHRIFGDAYRVASYSGEGSDRKVENIAKMFAYFAGGMTELVRRVQASRQVIEVYKVFESMKGFGEFLAHQIVVDLLYPNVEGHPIVPFGEDEFAKAGPGARKGLWVIIADDVKPANMTIVMEWLRDNQASEFTRLGIDFHWLLDANDDPRTMSLCDIQASLCEFYKYQRLWSGQKPSSVRKYDPSTARALTPHPVMLYDGVRERLLDPEFVVTTQRGLTADDVREAIDEYTEDGEIEHASSRELDSAEAPEPAQDMAGQVLDVRGGEGVTINLTINIYR